MSAYVRSLGAAPPASTPVPTGLVETMLARYQHYLTIKRGLGNAMAPVYLDAIRPFLRTPLSPDGVESQGRALQPE